MSMNGPTPRQKLQKKLNSSFQLQSNQHKSKAPKTVITTFLFFFFMQKQFVNRLPTDKQKNNTKVLLQLFETTE